MTCAGALTWRLVALWTRLASRRYSSAISSPRGRLVMVGSWGSSMGAFALRVAPTRSAPRRSYRVLPARRVVSPGPPTVAGMLTVFAGVLVAVLVLSAPGYLQRRTVRRADAEWAAGRRVRQLAEAAERRDERRLTVKRAAWLEASGRHWEFRQPGLARGYARAACAARTELGPAPLARM